MLQYINEKTNNILIIGCKNILPVISVSKKFSMIEIYMLDYDINTNTYNGHYNYI